MPMDTRNHRALSLLFLRFSPAQEALPPGSEQWTFIYTNANDFRVLPGIGNPVLQEDYEISRLLIGFRTSPSRGTEWYFELPLVARGGGFMDSIIIWWHAHVLGWSRGARELFPEGRSKLSRAGRYDEGSAFGLGDATAGYRRDLPGGLVLRAAAELPFGNSGELLGSGSADLGFSLDVSRPLGKQWTVAVQAAVVLQGDGGRLDGVRGLVDQESLAVIWSPNSKDQWVAQWQSERAPVETGVSGADATHRLITFGYRRRMSASETLELFFSEDRDLFRGRAPLLANVGPDFTFGVIYRVTRPARARASAGQGRE